MSTGGIGARIRSARRDLKLTQDALAAAVGVSRSAVAQWETDRAGQITGNLSRIASVLGVNVEWLVHGADVRAPLGAGSGDELAILRLYRECEPEDRQFLLRTARKLAKMGHGPDRWPGSAAGDVPSPEPEVKQPAKRGSLGDVPRS